MRLLRYLWDVLFYDMPKIVSIVFTFVVIVWVMFGMKKLEPFLFPVVTDFTIREIKTDPVNNTQYIRGSFVKVRDCRPLEIVGYHDNILLIVDYHQKRPEVSTRSKGLQFYDWWQIIPPVNYITLYVRHSCEFGTVTTKMYEGEIKAIPYGPDDERPIYD